MQFQNVYNLVNYVKANHKKGDYIYRGQTQPWKLSSSLFRIEDDSEREELWGNTSHFCNWLLNNERLATLNMDIDKALAISQHHGYKTDLVDFSWNIEVAAYFATNGTMARNIPGAIWAIEWDSFKKMYQHIDSLESPKLIEVRGLWRLENQQGLFIRDQGGSLVKIVGGAYPSVPLHLLPPRHQFPQITQPSIRQLPQSLLQPHKRINVLRLTSPKKRIHHCDSLSCIV